MTATNTGADWTWYQGRTEPMRYGHSDATYAKAIGWLAQDCATIQDWGAGMGYARKFVPPGVAYTSVDWAPHSGADITADLATWQPGQLLPPDGILLRHVLEHIPDWERVLDNAALTCRKRLVVVLFTPVTAGVTRRLSDGWQVDWSFSERDILTRIRQGGLGVHAEEHVNGTGTQYDAGEHIFYCQRQATAS